MASKTSEKLESHRLKYHKEQGMIQLFLLEDLTPDEFQFVSRLILAEVAKSEECNRYKIAMNVLREWGIMCPHPLCGRLYGEEIMMIPSSKHRWFRCVSCDSYAKNEYWKPELPTLAANKA